MPLCIKNLPGNYHIAIAIGTMPGIICDRIWEKGPYRAFKKNRVITTIGKSRL